MSQNRTLRAFAYVRASTGDQGLTIEAQKHRIDGYCQQKGLELAQVFVDENVSGSLVLRSRRGKDRKGGGGGTLCVELRKAWKRSEPIAIVFCKLDRCFRNTIDALTTIEQWESRGFSVHVVDESIDTSTPQGRFVLTIMSGLATMEREQTALRTRQALAQRKRNGLRVSRRAPWGHRFEEVATPDGHKTEFKLVEDEREQEALRVMIEMRHEGSTLKAISQYLAGSGVFGREGKPLEMKTIARILRDHGVTKPTTKERRTRC